MIEYDINTEKSITITIGTAVSKDEMLSLAFAVEALTEGNPNAKIRFRLHEGIPIHWIKNLEQFCENIPNSYTIAR